MPTFVAFIVLAVASKLAARRAVFALYRRGTVSARIGGALMGVRWGVSVLFLALAAGAAPVHYLILLPAIAIVILAHGLLGINDLPEFHHRPAPRV